MVVDVSVTVWAADAHDFEAFELAVVPLLDQIYGDVRITANEQARRAGAGDAAESFVIRFPLRVEAPNARVAATMTKQRVQQAMRDVGVRGVVSVLDGWPVT
jgi:putative hemolysin